MQLQLSNNNLLDNGIMILLCINNTENNIIVILLCEISQWNHDSVCPRKQKKILDDMSAESDEWEQRERKKRKNE